jgi:hypothetical protein
MVKNLKKNIIRKNIQKVKEISQKLNSYHPVDSSVEPQNDQPIVFDKTKLSKLRTNFMKNKLSVNWIKHFGTKRLYLHNYWSGLKTHILDPNLIIESQQEKPVEFVINRKSQNVFRSKKFSVGSNINKSYYFESKLKANKKSIYLPNISQSPHSITKKLDLKSYDGIPPEGVFDSWLNRKTREFFKNKLLGSAKSSHLNMYTPDCMDLYSI